MTKWMKLSHGLKRKINPNSMHISRAWNKEKSYKIDHRINTECMINPFQANIQFVDPLMFSSSIKMKDWLERGHLIVMCKGGVLRTGWTFADWLFVKCLVK